MRIAVVGTGYVGLVTGACLAEAGHNVSCIDTNKAKIRSLTKLQVPFYEPQIQKLIEKTQATGRINFTSSYKKGLLNIDAIFLCVGTPPKNDGNPNLHYLEQAIQSIGKHCSVKRQITVFIKSTVMVGANEYAKNYYETFFGIKNNLIFASNPEFLKEGNAVKDFKEPDRIIIGTNSQDVRNLAAKIYKKFSRGGSILQFTSIESAELIKYASNAFLATKISFINEIALLSDKVGADINEIQRGMGSDSRIGNKFLNAGLGFGGSCFPKDLDGLIKNYEKVGLKSEIASAAKRVNERQMDYFFKKIIKTQNINKLNVMIWGLSFKSETDDVRESVGIKLVKKLSKLTHAIYAYDPIATDNARIELKLFKNIKFLSHQYEKIEECDILILCTEWAQFNKPSIKELRKLKLKTIFDGRNYLDSANLKANNIKYIGIGKR